MDIQIENHGSILLFRPLTEDGAQWLREHADGQWFGGALVVEPRYAADLAAGAQDGGLSISPRL